MNEKRFSWARTNFFGVGLTWYYGDYALYTLDIDILLPFFIVHLGIGEYRP